MRHAIVLSVVSFVLHLMWESSLCPLFYVHGSYDATWTGMVKATIGDVLLTWIIFAGVAVVSGRWRWDVGTWSVRQWAVLIGVAVLLAVAVEIRALVTGRWDYKDGMPVVPGLGVGLLPLAQLSILTPVSLLLARRGSARRASRD